MRLIATKILRFTHGRTFEQYGVDEQLRWSVERGFEIIGEASEILKCGFDRLGRIGTLFRLAVRGGRRYCVCLAL